MVVWVNWERNEGVLMGNRFFWRNLRLAGPLFAFSGAFSGMKAKGFFADEAASGDAAARRTQPGKWHAADSFWLNAAGLASRM